MGPKTKRLGLPALALAVLYSAAVLAPLVLAWTTGIAPAGAITEMASAAGLIAGAMLLAQFVTSGRFERLSGRIGIDHTMAFHKWAGRIVLALVILHPLLFALPNSLGRTDVFWARLTAMLGSPHYLSGVLALGLVGVLVVMALLRNRLRVPYEWWRASHDLMTLAAAWLAATHAAGVGTYSEAGVLHTLWPALAVAATAILIGTYGAKSLWAVSRGWSIEANRRVANGLWEIVLSRDVSKGRFGFEAGQFAWLTFAPRQFPLFDHPFSIASSPNEDGRVSFVIKEAGDFTDKIGAIAPGTAAFIDGPHGSFSLAALDADAVILIAGGVGIAPILGVLKDLAKRGDQRPVRLLYGDGSPADLIVPDDILDVAANLDLVAQFIVERPDPDWRHQIGIVDRSKLSQALAGLTPKRTAALICGPNAMVASVSDQLEALGLPSRLIRYERFDFAGGRRSAKDRRITMAFRLIGASVLAVGTLFALR